MWGSIELLQINPLLCFRVKEDMYSETSCRAVKGSLIANKVLRDLYSVLYLSSPKAVFFSASNQPIQVTKEPNNVKRSVIVVKKKIPDKHYTNT